MEFLGGSGWGLTEGQAFYRLENPALEQENSRDVNSCGAVMHSAPPAHGGLGARKDPGSLGPQGLSLHKRGDSPGRCQDVELWQVWARHGVSSVAPAFPPAATRHSLPCGEPPWQDGEDERWEVACLSSAPALWGHLGPLCTSIRGHSPL